MSKWSARTIGVLCAFFTATIAVGATQPQPVTSCSLFVQDYQLCKNIEGDRHCRRLTSKRHVKKDVCLVRNFKDIRNCRQITIAQNTRVRIRDLSVAYTAQAYPLPSHEFFKEVEILESCVFN